ncbi:hypothetical protein M5K25_012070 [Dendrobium thyrsiflorum]|uniref:Uncharacterized protein n=1 Tax=Dendrobium thyrsiflorum TaxID=117978 RepID=A0ABD0UX23_DENTH
MGKGLLDLEKHFAFYGAYHSNSINVLIHIFFVWPIFFSSLILLDFTPSILHIPVLGGFDLNFSFFFALFYAVFYISLDRYAGSFAALLCLLCWFGSKSLAAQLGFSLAWKVVLATQLFCWTGQFIGHGVFEKRAPALLDNLSQAFLMAPFFVLLELLQSLFGYEPYPGFHANVLKKIEVDREQWEARKQKKSS